MRLSAARQRSWQARSALFCINDFPTTGRPFNIAPCTSMIGVNIFVVGWRSARIGREPDQHAIGLALREEGRDYLSGVTAFRTAVPAPSHAPPWRRAASSRIRPDGRGFPGDPSLE